MSTPYQEEEGGTFESNGIHYDLNKIFRAVAHLPVLTVKVNRLKWMVTPDVLKHIDQARVDRADLSAPLLITMYQGQFLAVDGLHRVVKAIQTNTPTLTYRRVPKEVLDAAALNQPGQPLPPEWRKW